MKLKSVSAFGCEVEKLDRTIKFYESLGFVFRNKEAGWARAYLNWFWIEFHQGTPAAGEGVVQYVNVEDIDEFYEGVKKLGYLPEGEVAKVPQGRRQFVLKDPDGYKLVFFQKL